MCIGGKRFTRANLNDILQLQMPKCDGFPGTRTCFSVNRIGQAIHDSFQRASCFVSKPELKPPAREQEEHKHGERIEIHFGPKRALRLKGAQGTDHKGDPHADGHRQVHADFSLFQIEPSRFEKRHARKKQNGQRQNPRSPTQQLHHVGGNVVWLAHVNRCGIHHDLHHAQARHTQTPQHFASVFAAHFVGQGIVGRQSAIA